VFEGIGAQVESMVAATALKGAAQALADGQGAEAEWLVRRALRACPYDERLYRALLRATDAQGNRAGLRQAMAELHLLSSGAEPSEPDQVECRWRWLHPQTLALYRELTRSEGGIKGSVTRL
jgi:DNA-binding SARP family transcriptional activator